MAESRLRVRRLLGERIGTIEAAVLAACPARLYPAGVPASASFCGAPFKAGPSSVRAAGER